MRALWFVFLLFCVWSCDQPEKTSPDVSADPEVVQVATWNMRFFPSSPNALERAINVIEDEEWDFLAMQELYEPNAISGLLQALPTFEARAFPEPSGEALSVGVLYNTERFAFISGGPLTQLTNSFDRTPMEVVLSVNGTEVEIRFISVHLRSGVEDFAEAERLLEIQNIEAYARTFVDAGEYVVILGDYNEAPSDPRYDEVMAPFFDSPERYRVISAGLTQPEDATFLPAGVILDQSTVSANLVEFVTDETVDVVRLNERFDDYEVSLSDHLPLHFELIF